eukprot:1571528-Pyramimonas_sp.AAC.1
MRLAICGQYSAVLGCAAKEPTLHSVRLAMLTRQHESYHCAVLRSAHLPEAHVSHEEDPVVLRQLARDALRHLSARHQQCHTRPPARRRQLAGERSSAGAVLRARMVRRQLSGGADLHHPAGVRRGGHVALHHRHPPPFGDDLHNKK